MNYQPLPNGYKICDECGISVHKVGYSVCFHCFGKKHPDLYEKYARNFRASTDTSIIEGHQGGIDGSGAGETRQDKPETASAAPGPIDYD